MRIQEHQNGDLVWYTKKMSRAVTPFNAKDAKNGNIGTNLTCMNFISSTVLTRIRHIYLSIRLSISYYSIIQNYEEGSTKS